MKITNHLFLLLSLILLLLLSSCILAELAAIEGEAAIMATRGVAVEAMATSAAEEALLSASQRSLLVSEVPTITRSSGVATGRSVLTELENVRLVERPSGQAPQLRLLNSNTSFAEIVDKRTIKFLDGRGEIPLHTDVYAIKGNNVNFRTSPTQSISNIKNMLQNGQLAIKVGEQNGWYKVLIGHNNVGWINGKLLLPCIIAGVHSDSEEKSSIITTNYPNGKLKTSYAVVKNKVSGFYRSYYSNGQLEIEKKYEDGKLIEVLSIYDVNGYAKNVGSFYNGNGDLNIYDENGNLTHVQHYMNGALDYTSIAQKTGNTYTYRDPVIRYSSYTNAPTVRYSLNRTPIQRNRTYTRLRTYNNTSPDDYQTITDSYDNSVTFRGNVHYYGIVRGSVTIASNANVVVEPGAVIMGSVILSENSSLKIYGTVLGDIYNNGGTIQNYGNLQGNIIREQINKRLR